MMRQEVPEIFTEEHYAYGTHVLTSHGVSGFPPHLSHNKKEIEVCMPGHPHYIKVAQLTETMMRFLTNDYRPKNIDSIPMRTPSDEAVSARWSLIKETYIMQEFLPDGRNHPLYKAAISKSFADFQAGLEAFLAQHPEILDEAKTVCA